MALLRPAGAGHLTDRIVSTRLGTAAAFVVVWLGGGALSPQVVTILIAAFANGEGAVIGHT
jgi:hypothetical protein